MKIKELLSDSSKWCKDVLAKDKNGQPIDYANENACKWCLGGAIALCYTGKRYVKICKIVESQIPGTIPEWNDEEGRCFEDVKRLVEELNI